MNIIYFLLPVALLLGLGFAAAFVLASWWGQFDDLETPAHRILIDLDKTADENSEKGTST